MPKNIRPIRIEGSVAYITLTQGHEAIIDSADVTLVSNWNWCADVDERRVYAVRGCKINGKYRQISLHRFLMKYPCGLSVDHISGNGLDCRRSNMRTATGSENMMNQRLRLNSRSTIKGVSWDKERKKWRATIMYSGKYKLIGRYESTDDAREAYRSASILYHGNFSRPD